jgi:hypothetical protein
MAAPALASLALIAALTSGSTADLGVEIPTLGITFHNSWKWTYETYFGPAVAVDIAKNLHASYVRTGWIPNWYRKRRPWVRENQVLDGFCGAGLHVMIIVPGLDSDSRGEDDLLQNVHDFFTHFTAREPGCLRYAEIANEADLPSNGFRDVAQYAGYYAKVAPIVASFGIPAIASGVSGKDVPWVSALASTLREQRPRPPVDGFGFHPYGVKADELASAVAAIAAAAGPLADGSASPVCITEIGRTDPTSMYETIVTLGRLTPTLTIYEYRAQPNDPDDRYGLVNHPALYDAVRRGFAYVREAATP